MLKLSPAPTFDFNADITVPGAEAQAILKITARHKGREALQAWIDSAKANTGDVEFLALVIAGWEGVYGDDGQPVPFSAAALARLLDAYPASGRELFDQYLQAHTESRRKN